ncbi:MAG: potassium transporter TrkA [Chloroflexota bacterium]
MQTFSKRDRLRYWFDTTMSRGAVALISWLFIGSLGMIIIFALLIALAGVVPAESGGDSLAEVIWLSAMHALEPGIIAEREGTWQFRLTMLVLSMGGLFLVSILIGIVTSGIEGRLDELRKGRSPVIEENHTVILGWSNQIYSIVSELVIANENQHRPVIAILGNMDKVEMEDAIREQVGHTKNTRIVCRSGNPTDMRDISIVNPHMARSVVVPSPDVETADIDVIKTILALTNNPGRHSADYHIVATLRQHTNRHVAELVGQDELELVLADDLIARLTVQTSLHPGLSLVYTELFDFDGDEIYFQEEPQLVGKTFGEALFCYAHSTLMGLRFADGHIQLKPSLDTVIQAGDQVIAISEDDDTVKITAVSYNINTALINTTPPASQRIQEATLVLGWNRRASLMIYELDHYVMPGTRLTVVSDASVEEMQEAHDWHTLRNLQPEFLHGDVTSREVLDSIEMNVYKRILLLSESDHRDMQTADSRTLVTLLHLRDIVSMLDRPISITSEMLDVRNRDLARVTQADDFIVSERLISLLLAQISENKDLAAVFDDLFDAAGSEIYLKPIGDYVQPNTEVNFYTLLEAARQRNEIAIGYRRMVDAYNPEAMFGVSLNPDKRQLTSFSPDDLIIVLAEEQYA